PFLAMLAAAIVTSRMKVTLPGMEGNLSVNLPFLLMAAVQFNSREAVVVAFFSTLVQCLSKSLRLPNLVQMMFNCSAIVISMCGAQFVALMVRPYTVMASLPMVAASIAYLFVNLCLVSTVIALSDDRSIFDTLGQILTLTFPHFVLGA